MQTFGSGCSRNQVFPSLSHLAQQLSTHLWARSGMSQTGIRRWVAKSAPVITLLKIRLLSRLMPKCSSQSNAEKVTSSMYDNTSDTSELLVFFVGAKYSIDRTSESDMQGIFHTSWQP
ncbi:hypothetical protein KCU74_g114, partial [Aureobasidium melanogenum]